MDKVIPKVGIIFIQDGRFWIDTQTGWVGLSDTPILYGYSEWLKEE